MDSLCLVNKDNVLELSWILYILYLLFLYINSLYISNFYIYAYIIKIYNLYLVIAVQNYLTCLCFQIQFDHTINSIP